MRDRMLHKTVSLLLSAALTLSLAAPAAAWDEFDAGSGVQDGIELADAVPSAEDAEAPDSETPPADLDVAEETAQDEDADAPDAEDAPDEPESSSGEIVDDTELFEEEPSTGTQDNVLPDEVEDEGPLDEVDLALLDELNETADEGVVLAENNIDFFRQVATWCYSMDSRNDIDLSKLGTLDWIDPRGSKNVLTTTNRKRDGAGLSVSTLDDTVATNGMAVYWVWEENGSISRWRWPSDNTTTSLGTSVVRNYWDAGDKANNDNAGSGSRNGVRLRPVTGSAYTDDTLQEILAEGKQVGFQIDVEQDQRARMLTFVAGNTSCEGVIEVYVNGSESPAVVQDLEPGLLYQKDGETVRGTVAKVYSLYIPENASVKVVGRMLKLTETGGVLLLGTASLGEVTVDTYSDAERAKLIALANDVKNTRSSALYNAQLEKVLDKAMGADASDIDFEMLKLAIKTAENASMVPWEQPGGSSRQTSILGWESDLDATIAYPEGSFYIRDNVHRPNPDGNDGTPYWGGFHIADNMTITSWDYEKGAKGYVYPCLISEFQKEGCNVTIKNFSDKITIGGSDYVALYSRVEIANNTSAPVTLDPGAAWDEMIRLNYEPYTIPAGETVCHDYVTLSDRFGVDSRWPAEAEVVALGGWDAHHAHMENYWTDRLDEIVHIDSIANEEIRSMLYATFVQNCIIKDPFFVYSEKDEYDGETYGNLYCIGENAYDRQFLSDSLEISAVMATLGDVDTGSEDLKTNIKDLLHPLHPGIFNSTRAEEMENHPNYWKLPWMAAVYLLKTGDKELMKEYFIMQDSELHEIAGEENGVLQCYVWTSEEKKAYDVEHNYDPDDHKYWLCPHMDIKHAAQTIVDDIEPDTGLMIQTNIDHDGYWLMGNWNALLGLAAYDWICDELGYAEGSPERMLHEKDSDALVDAKEVYDRLLTKCNEQIELLIDESAIDYLPSNIRHGNDYDNLMYDERDGNWAVYLFNGRWAWEGYLLGANQEGVMAEMVDDSYAHGLLKLENWRPGSGPYAGIPEGSFGAFRGRKTENSDEYIFSYCTSYNASYGAAALLGDDFRSVGLWALEFMLSDTQASPYGWWEDAMSPYGETDYPWWNEASNWTGATINDGTGSCPHMWGQLTGLKTVLDSFVSEKFDHTLIIGRGVYDEWVDQSSDVPLTISNYQVAGGKVGFTIENIGNDRIKLTVSDTRKGDGYPIRFELPIFQNNIISASAGTVDNAAGSVTLPAGVREVVVTIGSAARPQRLQEKYEAEDASLSGARTDSGHMEYSASGYAVLEEGKSVTFTVNAPSDGQFSLKVRYANGDDSTKSALLDINGTAAASLAMPKVAAGDLDHAGTLDAGAWDWWAFAEQEVALVKGENTITLSAAIGPVNVDYIRVTPVVDKFELECAVALGEKRFGQNAPAELTAAKEVLSDAEATAESVTQAAAELLEAVYSYVPADAAAAPVIHPNGGSFSNSQTVTITCAAANTEIYYTTDGRDPAIDGILYEGAITITETCTVKAIAIAKGAGLTNSEIASANFTRISSGSSSGSSGSGSGSSSTAAPSTPSVPSTPEATPTITPVAVVVNGKAQAAVSQKMADEVVDKAVTSSSEVVVVAPQITGEVTSAEVTIPASAISGIAGKTDADLKVETPIAVVTIPNEALSHLNGEVTVSTGYAGKTVEVLIEAGGREVSQVSGGIKAEIPVECGPGTVAKLVDANGDVLSTVRRSSADSAGQTMTVPLDGSARIVFVENSKRFSDVSASDWAADAVAFASSHELMKGVSANTFSPNESMTRGMLAMVLHNLEGNPSAAFSGPFRDVAGGAWYAEVVQWAADRGVITGVSAGVFAPEAAVTREQLAVMLYRYVGQPAASSGATSRFRDSSQVSSWARDAMDWAVSNGILKGSNGALAPQSNATRAEVAQMLMNFVSGGVL